MKVVLSITLLVILHLLSFRLLAQPKKMDTLAAPKTSSPQHLYIDVHHLGPGKVTYQAVADAHAKDLAVEQKYGVRFLQYWVDEAGGDVYCLSSSADTQSIRRTHGEAHGLLPDQIYAVTDGQEAPAIGDKHFYLDIHQFSGNVAAKDVAAAHQKDLAVEGRHGVNFINYWVTGNMVMCLSQAPDSTAVVETHKEAHGLMPVRVMEVKPGK
ncbi:MAG TPA: DUF4242 domain-containing protein [Puia sp.]|nr:DUF4242 domain-containing protein [Puia sp.]